jgi:methylenetetrahydrofolate reductase (NADPH)
MKISAAYGDGRFGLSFELFPPKTQPGMAALFQQVARLMDFSPSFITCTYGAGGSSQDTTLEVVSRVHQDFGVAVATHLTCVGRTVDELRDYLRQASGADIQSVVALRGDPPRGDSEFRPVPGGFRYANELVSLIDHEFPEFDIAVAGYPETHQEAPSSEIDLENLKRKVDAGADVVITQLFFDNDDFFRFRDRCDAAGIRVPIVPGLFPVTSLEKIQRFTSFCGSKLPKNFIDELAAVDENGQLAVGINYASRQMQALVAAGVPGVHFYVMNRSDAVAEVLANVTLVR